MHTLRIDCGFCSCEKGPLLELWRQKYILDYFGRKYECIYSLNLLTWSMTYHTSDLRWLHVTRLDLPALHSRANFSFANMSAKAIREFDGKQLLCNWFNDQSSSRGSTPYAFAPFLQIAGDTTLDSLQAQSTTTLSWLRESKLVVKPDQLIKRRGKAGLIGLNLDMQVLRPASFPCPCNTSTRVRALVSISSMSSISLWLWTGCVRLGL